MLTKSKRNAFVMSSIGSLTYFVTNFCFNLAKLYVMTGTIPSLQEEFKNIQLSWETFVILIITLLLMIGGGGLMINSLFNSDIHFGISGVVRWGLFGMVDAVLVKIYSFVWSTRSFALQELIELAIVPVSYVIVFKIFAFSHKEKDASI